MHLGGAGTLREAALITAGGLLQTLLALPLRPQPDMSGTAVRSGAHAHAARLAVGLMIAVAAYQALDMRFGYWLPVTVLFVLKPSYETTVVRMLERALGTLAGIAIASLLVTVCHPSDAAIVVLLAGLAAAAYAVYFACYALSSVLLTVLVALLVEFGGGSPIGALGDRAIDTLAGAAIALGVVTVARRWPSERSQESRPKVRGPFLRADGRTRTGDPFITSRPEGFGVARADREVPANHQDRGL